jgi:Winged helix-turn-helix domain (DUF2582)
MMDSPQLESQEFISPLSSDTFDRLLRRATLNFRLTSVQTTEAKWDKAHPEFVPIGGAVWHLLHQDGPTSFAALIEIVGVSETLLFMAVGWLARESKITIAPHDGDYEIGLK